MAAADAARSGDGTCDVVAAVTDEFALLNLADLLGVPAADRGLLLGWTRRVIGYQDPEDAGPPEPGRTAGPPIRVPPPCWATCSASPGTWLPSSGGTPVTT